MTATPIEYIKTYNGTGKYKVVKDFIYNHKHYITELLITDSFIDAKKCFHSLAYEWIVNKELSVINRVLFDDMVRKKNLSFDSSYKQNLDDDDIDHSIYDIIKFNVNNTQIGYSYDSSHEYSDTKCVLYANNSICDDISCHSKITLEKIK